MTKNNNLATKRQRTTLQRPKDKEQQFCDQNTKSNNTTTKRQRGKKKKLINMTDLNHDTTQKTKDLYINTKHYTEN